MARNNDQILSVYRSDEFSYFPHPHKYKLSHIRRTFRHRLERGCRLCGTAIDPFPGLILEDQDGNLFVTELRVELIPYKPEE
jgi:hypothetical protein